MIIKLHVAYLQAPWIMFQLPMVQKNWITKRAHTMYNYHSSTNLLLWFYFIFWYFFCCGLGQSTSLFAQIDGQKDNHKMSRIKRIVIRLVCKGQLSIKHSFVLFRNENKKNPPSWAFQFNSISKCHRQGDKIH
jgi:hypothetical protein